MGGHEQSTVASWDAIAFRRDLHAHPELAFAEHRTAARVGDVLSAAGLAVESGIAGTGIVASLTSGSSGRRIALRADMDALPITEATGLPYQSTKTGVFHGCGHDGHVTMLLGAALRLRDTRCFDGTVSFIFQPAEEGRAGARAMIADGLLRRIGDTRVFALHNWPQLPVGTLATKAGPIMAAADRFDITLKGRGGHAAEPHLATDVVLAAAETAVALSTLVSRRIDPAQMAVLSVTRIEGGTSHNVLPGTASLTGTARSFDASVRDRIEAELRRIVSGLAAAAGVEAEIDYVRYYPATINDADAATAALAAAESAGLTAMRAERPSFAAEDFAFILAERQGAYAWLGQKRGDDDPPLHHPAYDFNDAIIPHGVAWFTKLVEQELAA
jgi:hippurate hydrolase